ncbi:hypothetical protein FJT64_019054 [Amphibalanus amphitrite]|uniref:Inactive serine protease scarface clip-domain domain-containing protein n=1 Tax=Amphibalanus amphitrite TaxID=1232801 RepID=A0A6A4X644_AMPAM|nr:hypothetical protein FJT64_019054 [Amphibalanus amphitrite]
MLTLPLAAAVLACAAASPWKGDPWPAASQQRPSAVPANDPWPANNRQRQTNSNSLNPDDFWWDKPGANPFDDPASYPSPSGGSPSHRAPVRRPQLGVSGGASSPARAIVSVSSSAGGVPRVTGVRRTQVAFASASSPSRQQTSISSVSSGSFSSPNSGSYNSGSYSTPNSGSHSFASASQPQPSRFTPNQFGGAGSAPAQNQYAGSVSGGFSGSNGAQSPVVKACGASLFCVDTNTCDPYTGFIMDPSQGPIPQLDQPTVAFTRCYMNKSRSVGVCCQEPHINDPWTDRTTNGR